MTSLQYSARRPHTACTIEVHRGDCSGWDAIPGDASGWTLRAARRALRDYVASLPIEDVSDLYRITRQGREVERYSAELGRVYDGQEEV